MCKCDWRIREYDVIFGHMTVLFSNPEEERSYVHLMPYQISSLGLSYIPGYCMPGDHLPKSHPDYYKMDKDKQMVEHNGRMYELRLDPNFKENGTYRLVNIQERATLTFKAKLMNDRETNSALDDYKEAGWLPGSMIRGRVIKLIIVDLLHKKIQMVKHIETHQALQMKSHDVIVVLRDDATFAEFEFPLKLLKDDNNHPGASKQRR